MDGSNLVLSNQCMEIITMSEITAQTTVAELVTAFGLSSISDLVSRLERKTSKPKKGGASDEAVLEMAETVWNVISERGSTAQPWKSGTLTTIISKGELIKENDFDPELKKRRYAMHALIGKALKHLHAEGVLDKPQVKSAAHTHYKMLEGAQYGTQAEVEVLGLPGPVEEIQEAEVIEEVQVVETPKPKARVRKGKKK